MSIKRMSVALISAASLAYVALALEPVANDFWDTTNYVNPNPDSKSATLDDGAIDPPAAWSSSLPQTGFFELGFWSFGWAASNCDFDSSKCGLSLIIR